MSKDLILWAGIGFLVYGLFLRDKINLGGILTWLKSLLPSPAPAVAKQESDIQTITINPTQPSLVVEELNKDNATEVLVTQWVKTRKIFKKAEIPKAVESLDELFPLLNAEKKGE